MSMAGLRTFWLGLAPREQRILQLGAVVLLFLLIWLAVWEPLRTARDTARIRVAAAAGDLATMRAVAPQLRDAGGVGGPAVGDTRSLLVLVDATARASAVGEALLRVEPVAGEQVRVYFEGAGFDALVTWLTELEAKHGVVIGDLNVNRAAGVGRVDARLLLQRDRS